MYQSLNSVNLCRRQLPACANDVTIPNSALVLSGPRVLCCHVISPSPQPADRPYITGLGVWLIGYLSFPYTLPHSLTSLTFSRAPFLVPCSAIHQSFPPISGALSESRYSLRYTFCSALIVSNPIGLLLLLLLLLVSGRYTPLGSPSYLATCVERVYRSTSSVKLATPDFAIRPCHALSHDPGHYNSHFGISRAASDYRPVRYDSPFSSVEGADRNVPNFDQQRSWSASWESKQAQGKDFMSHWPNTQGHPSVLDIDGNARSIASAVHSRHASNTSSIHPSSSTTSPAIQRFGPDPSSRSLELPPLVKTSVSPSVPRSVTLPSVLNPIADEESFANQRRRKAEEIDSPHDGQSTLPPLVTASQRTASLSRTGEPTPLPLLTEPVDRPARRMLTPKSPLRRAISLSHLYPASGNIDAQQNPFPASPRSRPYAVEPGAGGAPALPTPPAGSYGYPSLLQTNLARTASPDSGSAQRYSASPSPDYSAYDHTSPTSDVPMPGYLSVSDSHRGSRGLSMPPVTSAPHVSESYHIPINSGSGQSSLQMMTIKTTEGDVRFPVDVQAASRVADEKRRRNAGASARFRERRKRKEVQATATIARLEQQVKDMTEDAEFYRQDRDMLASIMSQLPGGREHLPRPQSPRTRRNASMSHGTSQGRYVELQRSSPEPIRNVRKRGDSPVSQTYVQAPMPSHAPPPPPVQALLPQHHLQTHPQHPQIPIHAVHASSLPPPPTVHAAMSASSLPPPPPSIMQAPPMTGPTNPFARHEANNRFHLPPHGR